MKKNILFISVLLFFGTVMACDNTSQDNNNGNHCTLPIVNHFSTSNGLPGNKVNTVYYTDGTLYAATDNGLAQYNIESETWSIFQTPDIADNNINDVHAFDAVIVIATTKGISISEDNGVTWTTKTIGSGLPSNNVSSVLYINNTIYAGTDTGLAYSSDSGDNWTIIDTGSGLSGNTVLCLAYGHPWSTIELLYVGTTSGLTEIDISDHSIRDIFTTLNGLPSNRVQAFYRNINYYAATPEGVTVAHAVNSWNTFTTENGLPDNNIYSLHVSKIDTATTVIYAATEKGLSLSRDFGKSWTNYITSKKIHKVFSNGKTCYVATDSGLYECFFEEDKGSTLTIKIENLPETLIGNELLITVDEIKDGTWSTTAGDQISIERTSQTITAKDFDDNSGDFTTENHLFADGTSGAVSIYIDIDGNYDFFNTGDIVDERNRTFIINGNTVIETDFNDLEVY